MKKTNSKKNYNVLKDDNAPSIFSPDEIVSCGGVGVSEPVPEVNEEKADTRTKNSKKNEKSGNGITEIVFIIDKSGSMAGLEEDTIGGINAFIETQKNEEGTALVTTVLFSTKFEKKHDRLSLSEIEPMTRADYCVGGGTALYDALGDAIEHITMVHKYIRKEDVPEKTIFVITTDGMENASREYTYDRVRKMIEHEQEKYGWEFLFLGANIDAAKEAARFGITEDRAANYHADRQGTAVIYEAVCDAVCDVRASRPMSREWKRNIDADYKKRGSK